MSISSTLMDAKIATYTPLIDAQAAIDYAQNNRYTAYPNWNGEPDIYVDEYSNKTGVMGYKIRAFCDDEGVKKVKIVDKGNGGFDTGGWVEYGNS